MVGMCGVPPPPVADMGVGEGNRVLWVPHQLLETGSQGFSRPAGGSWPEGICPPTTHQGHVGTRIIHAPPAQCLGLTHTPPGPQEREESSLQSCQRRKQLWRWKDRVFGRPGHCLQPFCRMQA